MDRDTAGERHIITDPRGRRGEGRRPGSGRLWCPASERSLLDGHVGMEVDARGLDSHGQATEPQPCGRRRRREDPWRSGAGRGAGCLVFRDGQRRWAVMECLVTRCPTASRLSRLFRRVGNSTSSGPPSRSCVQTRRIATLTRSSGAERSFLPFPHSARGRRCQARRPGCAGP